MYFLEGFWQFAAGYLAPSQQDEDASAITQGMKQLKISATLPGLPSVLLGSISQFLETHEVYRLASTSHYFKGQLSKMTHARGDILAKMVTKCFERAEFDKDLAKSLLPLRKRCLKVFQKTGPSIRSLVLAPMRKDPFLMQNEFLRSALSYCTSLQVLNLKVRKRPDSGAPLTLLPLAQLHDLLLPSATDEDMQCFLNCTKLCSLKLPSAQITDKTLFPWLKVLWLPNYILLASQIWQICFTEKFQNLH